MNGSIRSTSPPPPPVTVAAAHTKTQRALSHIPPCAKQGKTSQFAPFGAGVTSYFKLLKYFSWSFLVVSLVVLPHLFVNTSGDTITTVTTNTDKMSWTTVGNLGGGRGNYSSVVGLSCSQAMKRRLFFGCFSYLTSGRTVTPNPPQRSPAMPPSPGAQRNFLVSRCLSTNVHSSNLNHRMRALPQKKRRRCCLFATRSSTAHA